MFAGLFFEHLDKSTNICQGKRQGPLYTQGEWSVPVCMFGASSVKAWAAFPEGLTTGETSTVPGPADQAPTCLAAIIRQLCSKIDVT